MTPLTLSHRNPPASNPPHLLPSQPHCENCCLHTECQSPGIPGELLPLHHPHHTPPPPDAPALILLGMNPGGKEDATGRPFVGPSGAQVRGIHSTTTFTPGPFTGPFLSLAHIYILNAVRCFNPTTPNITATHIKACSPYLTRDIHSIVRHHHPSPTFLLALGSVALQAAFYAASIPKRDHISLTGFFSHQSTLLPAFPLFLFATYHPAYYLRQRSIIHAISGHLSLLHEHITGTLPVPVPPTIVPPFPPKETP